MIVICGRRWTRRLLVTSVWTSAARLAWRANSKFICCTMFNVDVSIINHEVTMRRIPLSLNHTPKFFIIFSKQVLRISWWRWSTYFCSLNPRPESGFNSHFWTYPTRVLCMLDFFSFFASHVRVANVLPGDLRPKCYCMKRRESQASPGKRPPHARRDFFSSYSMLQHITYMRAVNVLISTPSNTAHFSRSKLLLKIERRILWLHVVRLHVYPHLLDHWSGGHW